MHIVVVCGDPRKEQPASSGNFLTSSSSLHHLFPSIRMIIADKSLQQRTIKMLSFVWLCLGIKRRWWAGVVCRHRSAMIRHLLLQDSLFRRAQCKECYDNILIYMFWILFMIWIFSYTYILSYMRYLDGAYSINYLRLHFTAGPTFEIVKTKYSCPTWDLIKTIQKHSRG